MVESDVNFVLVATFTPPVAAVNQPWNIELVFVGVGKDLSVSAMVVSIVLDSVPLLGFNVIL